VLVFGAAPSPAYDGRVGGRPTDSFPLDIKALRGARARFYCSASAAGPIGRKGASFSGGTVASLVPIFLTPFPAGHLALTDAGRAALRELLREL
jgi:hypothetical protein